MKIILKPSISLLLLLTALYCSLSSQELLLNGSFEDNPSPCPTWDCPHITPQCLPNWRKSHGTPNLISEMCGESTVFNNNYILTITDHRRGEGFFQGALSFVPGETYRVSVYLRAIDNSNHHGVVGVALYNGGDYDPQILPCQDPVGGPRRDVFINSTANFLNVWHHVTFTFVSMPGDDQYTQLMFYAGSSNLQDGETSIIHFDCASLINISCHENLIIVEPGYVIPGGNYMRSDYISISSTNPDGNLITTSPQDDVVFKAGNYIAINPGFISEVTQDGSFLCQIEPCSESQIQWTVISPRPNGCCTTPISQ